MKIDFSKEEHATIHRIQTIATTFANISRAYSSYYAYSFEEIPFEEKHQRKEEPIKFHRMSFQYFLVIQTCKLFEEKGSAISSLYILNEKLKKKYPTKYIVYDEVLTSLSELKSTPIYNKLKELRDKAYAHSDKHEFNVPLHFLYLTETETLLCKDILVNSINIFSRCLLVYSKEYTFHNFYQSSTPKNYLKHNFRSRSFFSEYGRGQKLIDANKHIQNIKKFIQNLDSNETQGHSTQPDVIEHLNYLEQMVAAMIESAYKQK